MQRNTLGLVHDFLERNVRPGFACIDATAGAGRDTALLCRLTGETGQVMAFDIQEEALRRSRETLEREGLQARLILDSHANMAAYVQAESVDCIVFNFGRLPGGDPEIMTATESSVAAIDAGLELLKSGGFMVLALYYGGRNGYGERDAILQHLKTLDSKRFSVLCCDWCNRGGDPPMPIFIWKD